jgi:phenylacetate-coenzyme A ligase PaaK-like adenylate-forming protein
MMNETRNIDLLLNSNPFEFSDESSAKFLASLRETALKHYHGNTFFKSLWDRQGIHPHDIKTEQDLTRMPMAMVNIFKEQELLSCPKSEIKLTLGSSGTGGQRSLMHLDQGSLDRVKKLAFRIHQELGITSNKKYNYLCFTYDPKVANDLGTAFTDELLTSFTGVNEVFYAIQYNEEKADFELNEKAVVEKLIEFSKSNLPLRILGFPAFLYKIIMDHNIHLQLPVDSWLQTGGGWKNQSDQEISKEKFRSLIEKRLGIPQSHIRDLFGMVEHGIPYVDCDKGYLRVPNYSRVFIRDPKTLEVLPYGEVGLIQFICTYNTSYPSMSLLTTDWGRLLQSQDSLGADLLEIMGRAGSNKHKGCAIKAAEMLRK